MILNFIISFAFGTALGMGMFVGVNQVQPIDTQTNTLEVSSMQEIPPEAISEIDLSEESLSSPIVLVSTGSQGSQQYTIMSQETVLTIETPIPSGTPTPFPTETSSPTPTPTDTPSPTTIPTITPSSTVTPTATVMFTVTVVPTSQPVSAPVNLDALFSTYAAQYNVDVNLLKKIARCESKFNTSAVGGGGLYVGMYQYAAGSWSSIRKQMGLDPNPDLRTNAEESIRTTAYAISLGRASMWPTCSN